MIASSKVWIVIPYQKQYWMVPTLRLALSKEKVGINKGQYCTAALDSTVFSGPRWEKNRISLWKYTMDVICSI